MQQSNPLPIGPHQAQADKPRVYKAGTPEADNAKAVKWPTLKPCPPPKEQQHGNPYSHR